MSRNAACSATSLTVRLHVGSTYMLLMRHMPTIARTGYPGRPVQRTYSSALISATTSGESRTVVSCSTAWGGGTF